MRGSYSINNFPGSVLVFLLCLFFMYFYGISEWTKDDQGHWQTYNIFVEKQSVASTKIVTWGCVEGSHESPNKKLKCLIVASARGPYWLLEIRAQGLKKGDRESWNATMYIKDLLRKNACLNMKYVVVPLIVLSMQTL